MARPAPVLLLPLAPVAALVAALWPMTALITLIVLLVGLLAWRAPVWAFALAILLVGFEGSLKLLLWLEDTPLPGGGRAAGAFALDVALFAAVAGLIATDRLATPRALWARMTRAERVTAGILAVWLALSVLQIAEGGAISRGLHGFRVFQAYTVTALAAAIVFARPRLRLPAARALLVVGGIVCAYAAFRTLVGATAAETDFATAVNTAALRPDENVLRTIGSFSGAFGLTSFLTPIAAFAAVAGYMLPELRKLAWGVAGLAVIALVGSFTRASLFGLGLGVAFAVVLVLFTADIERRRKLVVVGLALGALALTYGAVRTASTGNARLSQRASGLANPLADQSIKERLDTWRKLLTGVAHHPLGDGVGAVGRASGSTPQRVTTADNSFLKVLVEQGYPGFLAFVAGLVAAIVLLARRFRRAAPETRALGLAALSGFVAFLGIALAGEYVEQPGKVIAWGLLGAAAALALLGTGPRGERR